MRSCLVLGSGRSGTSMVAGMISTTGVYMGQALWEAREANPKGFFEDREINAINEDLLAQVVPVRPAGRLGRLFPRRLRPWQRWLAELPVETTIECPPAVAERIRAQVANQPFCFKDPRLAYTLPAWRPLLPDTVFVCVFREPARTARSIVREAETAPYLRGVAITYERALRVWTQVYRHVLERHRHAGEWLFLHYDQVLDGSGGERLSRFLDAPVDSTFADRALRRSAADGPTTPEAETLYRELCREANHALV